MVSNSLLENTIRRDQWNAVPPRVIDFSLQHPVKHLLISYTNTKPCTTRDDCTKIVKDLQTLHMDEPQPDIKHNFLIGSDGYCYVGRGWVSKPEVPDQYKDKVNSLVNIAYIGSKEHPPGATEKKVLAALVETGKSSEFIVKDPTIYEEL